MKWVTRETARVDRIACPWRCSIDAILDTYRLDDPALHALAMIVRGALCYPWTRLSCHTRHCEFNRARVAELADALDLGSRGASPWGFNSPLSHQVPGAGRGE